MSRLASSTGWAVTAGRSWVVRARTRRRAGFVSCAEVSAELPRVLDGGRPASPRLVAHVETCLTCHAELARYRRLVRLLRQLAVTEVQPPPGVVAGILSSLGDAAQRSVVRSVLTGRRIAYAAAVAAAAAATISLVGVARARTRPVVRAGAGAIVMVPGMLGAQPRGGPERPRRGQ